MFYDLENDDRLAVKKAVALAVSRYTDTIGKFVQDKADRLTIVGDQVDRIARECAVAVKADEEDVLRLFSAYLVDRTAEVAVSEPEHQDVGQSAEYNNSDEVPQPERGVRDDVKGPEAVLADDPAEHMEMPNSVDSHDFISKKEANPQAQACPYCGHMMTPVQNAQNPALSGQQQQCPNCGATNTSTPPAQGQMAPAGPGFQQGMQTGLGGGLYAAAKCGRCGTDGQMSGSILCEACNHFVVTGEASCGCSCEACKDGDHCGGPECHEDRERDDEDKLGAKEAQGGGDLQDPDLPLDESTKSPVESDPTEDQNLPPAVEEDSNGPAQVYTGVIQETANSDAAMSWSTPSDDDIEKVSQQYGLDPDEVRRSLRIVADFGDALAVNGDPNADPDTDGMTQLPDFGGAIPEREQSVDVQSALQHTADRTNLSPDDVYALVKESYGADLGDKHHVSVTGEAHYYLPAEMVPEQEQQPAQPQMDDPNETPQQAMQSSVPAHLQSIAAYLEWEKAQLASSAA